MGQSVTLTLVVDQSFISADLSGFEEELRTEPGCSSRFQRLLQDQEHFPSPAPATACHFQPHEAAASLADLLGALRRGAECGRRTSVLCVEGHNQLFCLHSTPAVQPGGDKAEYMILERRWVFICGQQL